MRKQLYLLPLFSLLFINIFAQTKGNKPDLNFNVNLGENSSINSSAKHKLTKYYSKKPLNDFLKYPISNISIKTGSRGDFYYYENKVEYSLMYDSLLQTHKLEYYSNDFIDDLITDTVFNNQVNANELRNIISTINNNPQYMPMLKDFEISIDDKKNYIKLLDTLFYGKYREYSYIKRDSSFYYSFVNKLDKINRITFLDIITSDFGCSSSDYYWINVKVVNKNGDSISISYNYDCEATPWFLPWKIEYKGQNFLCYNISLSNYINSCYPIIKKYDNRYLILKVADHFYSKSE